MRRQNPRKTATRKRAWHVLFGAATLTALFLAGYGVLAQQCGGGGGGGRLSPASLDLDTSGCPTTFGDPTCEKRTSWTIDKVADTGNLTDPGNEPFSFTVTVTEGPTTKTLTGSGQIVITNSGEQTTFLSSIAVLLEDLTPGTGNAPGPSGKNWTVLAAASQAESPDCMDAAVTCDGTFRPDEGTSLVLFKCDDMNDIIALTASLEILPSLDDDGDGVRDEDPIDGIDNDGDGLVDEDSACDANAVVICFEYEFDISLLDIEGPGDGVVPSADDLRIDLIATFKAGGKRGGTCSADVDCDGVVEDGKGGRPDEGEGHVRSIQQRFRFDPVECTPVCDCVQLTDAGAVSSDSDCATVNSTTTLNELICAAGGGAGTVTVRNVTGTVSCVGENCGADVINTAQLTCEDPSLISGSPASASFGVSCGTPPPNGPDPGDLCTQTQGGWGQNCKKSEPCTGGNTGCLRDCNFAAVFPTGLVVGGDPTDGVAPNGILLTSSAAVAAYLPAGGTPAALTADQTDPLTTSSGVFGGQLVAATINVAFDAAGIGKNGPSGAFPPGTLGTLKYKAGCVVAGLVGLSVNDVIALSNTAISGGGTLPGVTISDLNDALALLNQGYVDCDNVAGNLCLALP